MKRYIAKGLSAYLQEFHSVWHMPGHKRKKVADGEQGVSSIDAILDAVHEMDVTEVPGLDDLHDPTEMILESEKELARVYKTLASYYLVNGATSGILAALHGCMSRGDSVIVASNCHKSVHNTIELLGLKPIYVIPEELNIESESVKKGENDKKKSQKENELSSKMILTSATSPDAIESVCRDNPDAKAVILTSPTYEGVISDIGRISEIVHTFKMKLIVDEAHGAHLPFMRYTDDTQSKSLSAIYNGADVVIQSLHKTLPSMTQTAILHVMDEELNDSVKKYLSVFMSSSPSYVMLCDMERAVDIAERKNYDKYLDTLYGAKDSLKKLKNFTLLDDSALPEDKDFELDPTRLVIGAGKPLTGAGLEKLLSDEFGIVCEMSGINYVVLISTFADTEEDFRLLCETFKKIDDNYDFYINKLKDIEKKTNQVYTFYPNYEDNEYIAEMTDILDRLEGAAAKDNIYVYPPGIYLVRKGEIYTKEKLDLLRNYVAAGKRLHGEL